MISRPTSQTIDVDGGALHAVRWGDGPRVAVALHGITSHAVSWQAVGERLPADWSLVALDQRGRGRSRDLPGPYSVDDLARDARDAVVATGAEVLAGHSLGAYVAVGSANLFPDAAQRLVLVDGGIPLPVPTGLSTEQVDALLDATVGPAIARLRMTFADEDAYVAFFREHPAMGPYWNDDLEAYARYDAHPVDDGSSAVRAAATEESVRVSGRELITRGDDVAAALAGLSVPADLLVAPRGMVDEPKAFLSPDAVAAAQRSTDRLRVTEVPDTNHYTVLLGGGGADAVARAIVG